MDINEVLEVLQELYEKCNEIDPFPTNSDDPLYRARQILQVEGRIDEE